MIAWLKGKILYTDSFEVMIDVQGVGYQVSIGSKTQEKLQIEIGKESSLPVYTSVKENEIQLLGFQSWQSRKLFIDLIGVNGVGPKAGLAIVDTLDVENIISAIHLKEQKVLERVAGIGKKTAQRIILDLENKIPKFSNLSFSTDQTEGSASARPYLDHSISQDILSALVNLGFSESRALEALKSINSKEPQMDFNTQLKTALKYFDSAYTQD